MDDTADEMKKFDEMFPTLEESSSSYSKDLGLKLSAHKCEFGATKKDCLGTAITPQAIHLKNQNLKMFVTI